MPVHKVTYKGLSDVRVMSKKDLHDAGAGVADDLVWDKTKTGPRPHVFIQDASDRLLEIFRLEGTFTVSEVKEDNLREIEGVDPIMAGEPLDDSGSTVIDGSTGQRSTAGGDDPDADPVPSGTLAGGTGSAGNPDGPRAGKGTGKSGTGRAGKGSST